jgi:hypothetical protein
MKRNKIRLFEAQAARDSAHFRGIELKAFEIAGSKQTYEPLARFLQTRRMCWLVAIAETKPPAG